MPSRGVAAVERAVEWVEQRQPDLTLISGDLLSRRARRAPAAGAARAPAALLRRARQPRLRLDARPVLASGRRADLEPATLLADDARTIELRGRRVQIAGVDPRTFRRRLSQPERLVDESADLRILLCHFPDVIDRLPEGAFDLVLSGHLHAGQICLPWPGGRLRLAHIRWSYIRGLYRRPAATLHLSAGLGTTFVPFRFLARPEATELILESA